MHVFAITLRARCGCDRVLWLCSDIKILRCSDLQGLSGPPRLLISGLYVVQRKWGGSDARPDASKRQLYLLSDRFGDDKVLGSIPATKLMKCSAFQGPKNRAESAPLMTPG